MIRKLNWIQSTCLIPNEGILKVESISNGGLSTVVFSHCHTCRPRPFLHSSRFKTPILPSFTETRLRSNFCWSMLFDCKVLFFLKCIENWPNQGLEPSCEYSIANTCLCRNNVRHGGEMFCDNLVRTKHSFCGWRKRMQGWKLWWSWSGCGSCVVATQAKCGDCEGRPWSWSLGGHVVGTWRGLYMSLRLKGVWTRKNHPWWAQCQVVLIHGFCSIAANFTATYSNHHMKRKNFAPSTSWPTNAWPGSSGRTWRIPQWQLPGLPHLSVTASTAPQVGSTKKKGKIPRPCKFHADWFLRSHLMWFFCSCTAFIHCRHHCFVSVQIHNQKHTDSQRSFLSQKWVHMNMLKFKSKYVV